MVVARLRVVDVAAHVPLADERRIVTRLLHVFGEENQSLRQWVVIIDHVVIVRVLPRDNARAAGRTKGGGHKSVRKPGAPLRHAIQIWGFQKRMTGEPHRVITMVVR